MFLSLYVRNSHVGKVPQIKLGVKFPSPPRRASNPHFITRQLNLTRSSLRLGRCPLFNCGFFHLHWRRSALKWWLIGSVLGFPLGVFPLRFHSDFSLDRADVARGWGPDLSRGSFAWSGRQGGGWSGCARQMREGFGWKPGQHTEEREWEPSEQTCQTLPFPTPLPCHSPRMPAPVRKRNENTELACLLFMWQPQKYSL